MTGEGMDQPRFRDAMDELKKILGRIEREEVDLDELSDLVERAAQLIRLCRQRVVSTEMRVQEIIGELESDLAPAPST